MDSEATVFCFCSCPSLIVSVFWWRGWTAYISVGLCHHNNPDVLLSFIQLKLFEFLSLVWLHTRSFMNMTLHRKLSVPTTLTRSPHKLSVCVCVIFFVVLSMIYFSSDTDPTLLSVIQTDLMETYYMNIGIFHFIKNSIHYLINFLLK